MPDAPHDLPSATAAADGSAIAAPTPQPLVVLVHGAWHGAWCWATLQARLDTLGVPSVAIDLPGHGVSTDPLTDLYGDAAHVGRVLDVLGERGTSSFVLVGHSYGGAVITEAAGGRSDIAHLVYVAAFAVNAGESVMDVASSGGKRVALGKAIRPGDDGTTVLDPIAAVPALYGRCAADAVAAALPRLSPQPAITMSQPATADPRAGTPSTYVLCRQDEAVHPDHQAEMAERCSHTVEIDTDHSPFVSAVDELAAALGTVLASLDSADATAPTAR